MEISGGPARDTQREIEAMKIAIFTLEFRAHLVLKQPPLLRLFVFLVNQHLIQAEKKQEKMLNI